MPTARALPVLCPDRIRKIPKSFAWIDHQLRTNGSFQLMTGDDVGFYFFLALAADKLGLSCWRLDRVEREMPWLNLNTLRAARQRLIELQLVAYQPWRRGAVDGCYQLLTVPYPAPIPQRGAGPIHIGALLTDNTR